MAEEHFDPADDTSTNGDSDVEEGALAERLRNLSWPDTEPEHAEQAWKRFQRRLAEAERAPAGTRDDDESA